MNKEIDEILDYISDRVIQKEKWNKVKDYITNLQQENEKLKKRNKEIYEGFLATQEELSDYATRIEKAIEFINEYCKYNKITVNGNKYYDEYILNNVIDLLRGEDK